MKVTTLRRIKAASPCASGWQKLLKHLEKTKEDDEPLPFAVIIEGNGIEDALWCCRAAPEYDSEWRLYAVWCARQVQHLMVDPRSMVALDVAERHALEQATDDDLSAAREAAGEAAWAAARVAAGAAREAARVAAGEAAWAAARAAGAAARVAAGEAARVAAGAAQKVQFQLVIS